MTRFVSTLLASALLVTPMAAGAADLTVWWAKGYYPSDHLAFGDQTTEL
jgi:hypothetical protein